MKKRKQDNKIPDQKEKTIVITSDVIAQERQRELATDKQFQYLFKSWKWRLRVLIILLLGFCTFFFFLPGSKIPKKIDDGFPLDDNFPYLVILSILVCCLPLSALYALRIIQSNPIGRELLPEASFHVFGGTIALLILGIYGFAGAYRIISICDPAAFHSSSTEGVLDRMNAFYFSVITSATVGYGDIYPVSPMAKLIVTTQVIYMFLLVIFVLSSSILLFLGSGRRNL